MSDHKKIFKVAGLGEILWDLLPQGKQLGGAPANFAYHAQALGAQGFVVSTIGNDALGKEILNHLKNIKISTEYIHLDEQHPTGTVEVKLDQEGKPDFIIHKNVAWDYLPYSDRLADLASHLDAICFGSLAQRSKESLQSIQKIIATTPGSCLRIFDINIRQDFYSAELVEKNLKLANCLKLNDDELPIVTDIFGLSGSEENILENLLTQFGLRIIALTKGKEGSVLYSLEQASFVPSVKVEIVDTVGAGDAFTAALCLGLLHNLPLMTVHENATKIAAYVCTQKGATPLIPDSLKRWLMLSSG